MQSLLQYAQVKQKNKIKEQESYQWFRSRVSSQTQSQVEEDKNKRHAARDGDNTKILFSRSRNVH